MEVHRVRTIIPFLDYALLSKEKNLPKEKLFTAKTVESFGGKYTDNSLSKKLGPVNYGIFIEKIVETLLENECDLNSLISLKCDIENYKDLASLLMKEFTMKDIFVEAQVELQHGNIVGHPDLVSMDTVYDIKTTGQFGKMRIDTIFQLLSYYCLAQLNGLPVKNIGLVLPLQLKVITCDLKDWNWKPFYEELKKALDKKISKESSLNVCGLDYLDFALLMNTYVGTHCCKSNLLQFIPNHKPLQFFVGGNQTSKVSFMPKFQKDLKLAIKTHNASVYIHSPYVLNLCHPGAKTKGREDEDEEIAERLGMFAWGGWTFDCLSKLLEFGVETGIKGVVVHCGKTCKKSITESLWNMRESVITCSTWATKECPLIIETSAGQGGEVLSDPHTLACFYDTLPYFVKDVVTICVDTCHVFAAGYDPIEFIKVLEDKQVPITLFHFNDSKGEKGCKKDRHERAGQGYIGVKTMRSVIQYCVKNNIDMVVE